MKMKRRKNWGEKKSSLVDKVQRDYNYATKPSKEKKNTLSSFRRLDFKMLIL